MCTSSMNYSTRSKTGKGNLTKKPPLNPKLFEYKPKYDTGRGVISFTKHDQKQLQSPNYLNDTIITLFMQYHFDNFVGSDVIDKTHVFNSYFIEKIKSIRARQKEDGDVSYECASRWLGGAELFKKDFIIMPVCEEDHWTLIIVCYPSKVPEPKYIQIPDDELYQPAVFILNSYKEFAPAVKKSLSQFLAYQWRIENGSTRHFPIHNAKSNGFRLIFPLVPQQRNNYNCGVYLLNYFRCFLNDPRSAYLKMIRELDMSNWFDENQIKIVYERQKMAEIIRKMTNSWIESEDLVDRKESESPLKDSSHDNDKSNSNQSISNQDSIIVIN